MLAHETAMRSPVRLADLATIDYSPLGVTRHDVRPDRELGTYVPGWGDNALDGVCQWRRFVEHDHRLVRAVTGVTLGGGCLEYNPRNLSVLCSIAPYNATCPTVAEALETPRTLRDWDVETQGYCPLYCLDPARFDMDLNQYDLDFSHTMHFQAQSLLDRFPDVDAFTFLNKRNSARFWPALNTTLAQRLHAVFDGRGLPTPFVMMPSYFLSTEEANPNRTMVWAPPVFQVAVVDGLPHPTHLAAFAPVYVHDEMKGVVSAGLPTEPVKHALSTSTATADTMTLIVNKVGGSIIAAPDTTYEFLFCPDALVCDGNGSYNSDHHMNLFEGQPLRMDDIPDSSDVAELQDAWDEADFGSLEVTLRNTTVTVFWHSLDIRGAQFVLVDLVRTRSLEYAVDWSFNTDATFEYSSDALSDWWEAAQTRNASAETLEFRASANLTNRGSLRVPFEFETTTTPIAGSSAQITAHVEPSQGWVQGSGGFVAVELVFTVQATGPGGSDCSPAVPGAACGLAPSLPDLAIFHVRGRTAVENGRCFAPLAQSVIVKDTDAVSARTNTVLNMRTVGIAASVTLGAMLIVGAVCCGMFRVRSAVQRERKAKERLRQEEDFVSFVFHEMRTPLNGAHAYLNFARDGLTSGSAHDVILEDVDAACMCMDHSISVLDRMLDLARLAAGHIELQEDVVDVEQVVRNVMAMQAHIGNDRVEGRAVVDPGIESIICDKQRLRQVLLNLVSNASKYTAEGFLELRVVRVCAPIEPIEPQSVTPRSRLTRSSNLSLSRIVPADHLNSSKTPPTHVVRLRFEVVDSGCGVPQHLQHTLFKKYTRVATAESIRGTGLGLLISQLIVEKMGGVIQVESPWTSEHSGSRFSFEVDLPIQQQPNELPLPMASGETSDRGSAALSNAPHALTHTTSADKSTGSIHASAASSPHTTLQMSEVTTLPRNVRVLIVDDVALNLKILRRRFTSKSSLFAPLQWVVEEATTGEEMLARLQDASQHQVHLVVCDEIMVKTGGVLAGSEACRELRKWEQKAGRQPCAFVSCSGLVSANDQQAMLKNGVDLCWGKPVPSGGQMAEDLRQMWLAKGPP